MDVNEFKGLFEATNGNRKGDQEAGIRIANQRYIFLKQNSDKDSVYLAREGGGACVVRTE